MPFDLISSLDRRLRSVPPLAYLVLYFTCIPVFAAVYWLLPLDFYHSTAAKDPAMRVERQALARMLQLELQTRLQSSLPFRDSNVRPSATIESVFVRVGDVRLNASAEEDSASDLLCTIAGSMVLYVDATPDRTRRSRVEFELPVINHVLGGAQYDIWKLSSRVTHYSFFPSDRKHPPYDIGPSFEALVRHGGWNSVLSESSEVGARRIALGNLGYAGFQRSNVSRAVYLSIVTLTTLGFGDIVPLTDRARWIVGIEALAGALLAGAFLNGLNPHPPAPRRSRSTRPSSGRTGPRSRE